jgi:hypothetical protein
MNLESNKKQGKFAKGVSGNPAGRPPGSRNRATLLMEALLEGEAEQLTRKTIELAKEGDIQALRLCLDRLMPPGRDRFVNFELPPINSLEDISLGTMAVLKAVSEGKITPTECESLNRSLAEHAHVIEKGDHERRLQKLEQAAASQAAKGLNLEKELS